MLNPDVQLSHPSWFIVPSSIKDGAGSTGGTLQSRITCKNASHQTDPSAIEACRRSRYTDGTLVSMDLSQIELVVPALITGDPFYLQVVDSDLHTLSAIRIWGAPELISRYPELAGRPLPSWKKLSHVYDRRERQVGKRVNFSHLFRAGAAKMQASVHADIGELFPIELFESIVSTRSTDLPELWAWQESLIAEARSTGRVTLPLTGQSRSFLGGTDYDINEIVNFPVQTTASNVLRRIQSTIHRRLRSMPRARIHPFLNIYDAIKFDCATPSDVSCLTALIAEAVDHVSTHDYWSALQTLYGRVIPLRYTLEFHHVDPHPEASPPIKDPAPSACPQAPDP
jgi:hypothetical protein